MAAAACVHGCEYRFIAIEKERVWGSGGIIILPQAVRHYLTASCTVIKITNSSVLDKSVSFHDIVFSYKCFGICNFCVKNCYLFAGGL